LIFRKLVTCGKVAVSLDASIPADIVLDQH